MKKQRIKALIVAVLLVFLVSPLVFAMDNYKSLIKDGKISGDLRILSYSRDWDRALDRESHAIGGNFRFETAIVNGFSGGIGFKTCQVGDFQDDDKTWYRGLTDTNNEGYSAMSEYYLRYRGFDTTFTLGAQDIHTPFMEPHKIRMTDRSFRGLGIVNKSIKGSKLHAYYITDQMGWTDTSFSSNSNAYRGAGDGEGDALILGWDWKASKALSTKVWYYRYDDILQYYWFWAKYKHKISKNVSAFIALQYTKQDDVGDGLKGDIDTYVAGGQVGVKAYGFFLTGYYAEVGDDAVELAFGGGRWKIIQQQIWNSTWAELEVVGAKFGYNFGKLGIKGLSAYIFHCDWSVPDTAATKFNNDTTETDFNITYKFSGKLKGTYFRARYAIIDQDEDFGGDDFDDMRFYLVFKF